MKDWQYRLRGARTTLSAIAVFIVIFALYAAKHDGGFTGNVAQTAANKGVLLAFVAIGQCFVVLTAGIDLSVGAVFILADCLASTLVTGSPLAVAFGVVAVLVAGLACGLVNGLIVVYGRLQPIVATIATGAIYFGLALWVRPEPGGDIDSNLADAVTGQLPGGIPSSLVLLLAIILLVWVPFRRSVMGRAVYAVGSSEASAYMSGLPIRRAKLLAYGFAGLFSAVGGLMLSFITYSGEASATNASTYTLNSIAAVVIGGVSLFGGAGSAIGAVFGALIFRTINDLLFVFDLDPLWQPLFLGLVLLAAVSFGSLRLLRIRNRLELFGQ
ncbi:ABC transporter permease [Lichenifustis flavocetrariae]|uniref:ABC transporter permease n=1 Tax=Lichenifustis flavocetrariae TaxID=2949735 RepID=A0AA41YZE0_9HYPH|nr:ABC transporter permease [Lichenifustis flavocetrariae]MCW6511369.1 ABC transporter permease [Lichenifustis flavocetrariae]